ncbi:MAG: tetratricopeptide repeat protein, partial [Planctomycetes bacterium]|nr:tetratricopeptide repeat protein [Planctomycetota bacterium]
LLARLYQAAGDQRKCDDVMMNLVTESLTGDAGDSNVAAYVEFHINNLLNAQLAPIAENWVEVLKKREPNTFNTYLIEARVLLTRRPSEALAIVKAAVDNEEFQPDRTTKMANAAARLEEFANTLRDKKQDAAVREFDDTLSLYYDQLIGTDPARQLLRVPFLVRQNRAQEALEIAMKNWASLHPFNDIPLIITASSALLTRGKTGLDTAGQTEVERAIVRTLQQQKEEEARLDKQLAAASPDEQQEMAAQKEVLRRSQIPLMSTLANQYVLTERHGQALDMYKEVLRIQPTEVLALNNLAMIMAWQKTDLPAALQMVDQALALVGPVPTLVDSRAVILLNLGRPKDALAAAKQAVAEAPEKPDYWFHLALAQHAAGDVEGARKSFRRAKEELGLTEANLFSLERPAWRDLVGKLKL